MLAALLGLALLFYLLSRRNLLAGDTLFIALTLLLCLIVVAGVLFMVFVVIAFSFKGRAFELTMSGLVFAVGLALTLLGWNVTSNTDSVCFVQESGQRRFLHETNGIRFAPTPVGRIRSRPAHRR